MPLIETDIASLRDELAKAPLPVFVIFTSASVNGQHWCPPCAKMEPYIQELFPNSDAVGIVVRMQTDEVMSDANWTLDAWGGGGVPLIHRIVDGKAQGEPLAYRNDPGFATDLERFVESEDAHEAWLKERRGDAYVEPEIRIPATRAKLDALVAKHRELERKYTKEVGSLD